MTERHVKCSHPGCQRKAIVFGMCRSHYREYKKDETGKRFKNPRICGNCMFFITTNHADGHTGECHFKKIADIDAGDVCCRHYEPNILWENHGVNAVERRVRMKKIENMEILKIKLRVAGYAILAVSLLAAMIGFATLLI